MQRQGLESTYLSICNKLNKVLKLWHTDKPLLLYRCGYSQLIIIKMTHVYKAKCYAILKVGAIPVEFQEDAIFHCETDLLEVDIDINLNYFEEKFDDEWISLQTLKERRTL
jgi:hypothetical protein